MFLSTINEELCNKLNFFLQLTSIIMFAIAEQSSFHKIY